MHEVVSRWTNESAMVQWINEAMNSNEPVTRWFSKSMHEWTSGLINQWTNDWVNEWVDESTNQWISESLNHWFSESINQWTNESTNAGTNESVNPWTNEPMNQWMKGWMDGWMNMDRRATFLCWATPSLSDLFAEAPLLSATSSLSGLSWLLLLWAASQLLFCRFCSLILLFAQLSQCV